MKTLLIPMAGLGSRFTKAGFDVHKPLIEIEGKTLIRYSIDSLGLSEDWNVVIVARDVDGSQPSGYREQVEEQVPEATIIWIDSLTTGATHTCLFAKEHIDPKDELIITNCDQYLDWDSEGFLEQSRKFDGSVLTYYSRDPKNSFCITKDGRVTDIIEKKAVSDDALVGLHWWKKGSSFIQSAEKQVNSASTDRETYVSESYRFLIDDGKTVGAIPIDGKYWSLGTPEDFYIFKGYLSEYRMSKPQTFFIDLDGTVLMHGHRYSKLHEGQEPCPGVVEALDELDSQGHKIILCSARKESARSMTERLLENLGIPYDQLILGVSQGCRTIVNDISTRRSTPRARAINVLCDGGWSAGDLL